MKHFEISNNSLSYQRRAIHCGAEQWLQTQTHVLKTTLITSPAFCPWNIFFCKTWTMADSSCCTLKKPQSKAALLVSHTSGTFLKNELLLSWLPRLTQKHKLFNIQHQTYKGKKENTARGQRWIRVTPKPEELSQSSEAAKALKRNRKSISNNTQV